MENICCCGSYSYITESYNISPKIAPRIDFSGVGVLSLRVEPQTAEIAVFVALRMWA